MLTRCFLMAVTDVVYDTRVCTPLQPVHHTVCPHSAATGHVRGDRLMATTAG
jgi:hypothetical protein